MREVLMFLFLRELEHQVNERCIAVQCKCKLTSYMLDAISAKCDYCSRHATDRSVGPLPVPAHVLEFYP